MFIRSNRPFNPPVDVIELTDRLLVIVEIAGMVASDFNITLNNRRLTVAGLRRQDQRLGLDIFASRRRLEERRDLEELGLVESRVGA